MTVAMPCYSSPEDLEDATLTSNTFDVPLLKIDITETYNTLESEIIEKLDTVISKETKINIKPRLRMTTLYAIAQTMNYLVIGTGNLSEAVVGYTTKWGDSSYDFNPIASFTVEEVRMIGEFLGVPDKIIKKAPSDGVSGKTDEDNMGITYSQISEYINTGKTDNQAMEIIERMNKLSEHKRGKIPTYHF